MAHRDRQQLVEAAGARELATHRVERGRAPLALARRSACKRIRAASLLVTSPTTSITTNVNR
jgi:hypothetical protein